MVVSEAVASRRKFLFKEIREFKSKEVFFELVSIKRATIGVFNRLFISKNIGGEDLFKEDYRRILCKNSRV